MKMLSKAFRVGELGQVKMSPEEAEDMWHAYNLIRAGDRVTATTYRKVQRETGGGSESEKLKLTLTVQVEDVDFDPEGSSIRLKGRNLTPSEHLKLGAYHTLQLEPHRAFTIQKDTWDKLDAELVTTCCDPAASADLAVLLLTDGLANLMLVGSAVTLAKAKVESTIPRKRGAEAAGYGKAVQGFFKKVYEAVSRHVDWSIVKCLVIAGPGFTKDEFKTYFDGEVVRRDDRVLMAARDKVVLAHASTPYKHSLKEVLATPGVAAQIKDTKAARETSAMQAFYDMMSSDSDRAFYGPGHIKAAHELGAIQTLLISDKLFRVADINRRAAYGRLVEEVRQGGGEALVFSSMHVSGEQLNQISGIAALLRFPLPELADSTDLDTDIL